LQEGARIRITPASAVNLHLDIALSHLRSRRRQTIVSLLGVVLGVAFFLAVSALMRGSERDLIARLVDTQPHITVSDEFRDARPQPARMLYPDAARRDPRRQAALGAPRHPPVQAEARRDRRDPRRAGCADPRCPGDLQLCRPR
jgi:ABC-type lipoprotein release transport system permease subunit